VGKRRIDPAQISKSCVTCALLLMLGFAKPSLNVAENLNFEPSVLTTSFIRFCTKTCGAHDFGKCFARRAYPAK
jgi:hypothetical protein